jgi:hypothetical protein
MARLRAVSYILALFMLAPCAALAQTAEEGSSSGIESVTIEGAPIASQHFQFGEENFHERHMLVVGKIATKNYGNWGLYLLTPNSVEKTSVGFGYVTDPYVVPIGPVNLELSAGLGLVTGYQDYPVPLLAGQARLNLYSSGPWDFGLSAALIPYYTEDDTTGDNEWGVVGTTPFLSVRYNFR